MIPAPMIAAVVTACATGPCRSFWRVVSGISHGSAPPAATAANAFTGHATVTIPMAQLRRAIHFSDEPLIPFKRFISLDLLD